MSVLPVGMASPALSDLALAGPTAPTAPTPSGAGAEAAPGAGGGFANALGNALDSVASTQAYAANMATQAATGNLTNVADYMVAANEANVQTQLTTAVRNSALQAFQSIMGMQL
jgi:flagellar hook-basal body complex protein FliE